MGYRYGFKAEAERTALEQRAELGVGKYERLSPVALAEHLAIPLRSLSSLAATATPDVVAAVSVLMGAEQDAVSALTVMRGSRRVVVFNDAHSSERVANSIAHELSHGLLLHPGAPALDRLGCRHWDPDIEDEASFLGGALLIPASAARGLAKRGLSLENAAQKYGCSIEVVRWRLNVTGARKLNAG